MVFCWLWIADLAGPRFGDILSHVFVYLAEQYLNFFDFNNFLGA